MRTPATERSEVGRLGVVPVGPRAIAVGSALLAFVVLLEGPATAASLVARDGAGNQWQAIEDPRDEAQGYVLEHLGPRAEPDRRFGPGGRRALTISPTDDAPTALRVDEQGRIWIAGASIAGGQPQAVILRFKADGTIDRQWGVQGRLQVNAAGLAIKPNDLLPLTDGSLLVAGVAANVEPTRAVVLHLGASGALDTRFGAAGAWQRPESPDGSTATSLAAADDGTVAVAVAARGEHGTGEVWTISSGGISQVYRQELPPDSDGENLRVAWGGRRWTLATGSVWTSAGQPATLVATTPAVALVAGPVAADPGQAGFSPFVADAAPLTATRDEAVEPSAWSAASICLTSGIVLAILGAAILLARTRRHIGVVLRTRKVR